MKKDIPFNLQIFVTEKPDLTNNYVVNWTKQGFPTKHCYFNSFADLIAATNDLELETDTWPSANYLITKAADIPANEVIKIAMNFRSTYESNISMAANFVVLKRPTNSYSEFLVIRGIKIGVFLNAFATGASMSGGSGGAQSQPATPAPPSLPQNPGIEEDKS